MARSSQLSQETIASLIKSRGPVSATELASATRVNRTTIVRFLSSFGDDLVTLGTSRSTRYLFRRKIRNADHWPIYRIDESGRASQWAELESFHDHFWRVTWTDIPPQWAAHFTQENGLWMGFPFFLSDARPQGYLGRATARQISSRLSLPSDSRHWGDDDILIYLDESGIDLPGNHLVGENHLRATLSRSVNPPPHFGISKAQCLEAYPLLADQAVHEITGSSAGGEQPKFLTTLLREEGESSAVLVKFTAPLNHPVARRWADLLLCEFHAHQVLAKVGLGRSGCRILDSGNRLFLEVPRFDRLGAIGRRGIVSLEALHASAIGSHASRWDVAARELLKEGLIDHETQRRILLLDAFGGLIGNSDMHFGNLSFWMDDILPFQVAPVYDMLPMLWAPGPQGELVERHFNPAPPLPAHGVHWKEAAGWATTFWAGILADERLSEDFIPIAQTAQSAVMRLRQFVD